MHPLMQESAWLGSLLRCLCRVVFGCLVHCVGFIRPPTIGLCSLVHSLTTMVSFHYPKALKCLPDMLWAKWRVVTVPFGSTHDKEQAKNSLITFDPTEIKIITFLVPPILGVSPSFKVTSSSSLFTKEF